MTPAEYVASFAEAWIENTMVLPNEESNEVASFAEAWIENISRIHGNHYTFVASFAEAWIENTMVLPNEESNGRLLRGGVD